MRVNLDVGVVGVDLADWEVAKRSDGLAKRTVEPVLSPPSSTADRSVNRRAGKVEVSEISGERSEGVTRPILIRGRCLSNNGSVSSRSGLALSRRMLLFEVLVRAMWARSILD